MGSARLGGLVASNFVDELHNGVVFLYPEAVEVLAHRLGQLLLVLALLLAPQHRRGVETYASGLGEYRFVEGAREAARGVEVIFSAVGVERVAVKRGPLKLEGRPKSARIQFQRARGCDARWGRLARLAATRRSRTHWLPHGAGTLPAGW